mmetsp:Transcript_45494/g.110693  ORF Transcript_45494/g.110693 Transcript_45494/m.110693 type:complete len:364 (-) Transcript_45494:199-1290(-)
MTPRTTTTARPGKTTKMFLVVLAALLFAVVHVQAQFNEPPGQRREQTYRVLEFENSEINQRYPGLLRYYCTFRGKWNEERHPNDFPRSPSWSGPTIISHSNGYRMWTGTETITAGGESIAEEGFSTIMEQEFLNAGYETLQMIVGDRMFNTSESQTLPPINVTMEHPFLSSMVKVTPSPDWFVGFSDFRTISYDTETYYNRFVIQSYVWDSGTDAGQTYTALDRDLDPQIPVYRFCVRTPPGSRRKCPDLSRGWIETPARGQFLDYTGTYIPTPAEFECVLRVGNEQIYPGVPFDESQIRPPNYVARPDDDFVQGISPRDPDFEEKTGLENPRTVGSGGTTATSPVTSTMMMMLLLSTMLASM